MKFIIFSVVVIAFVVVALKVAKKRNAKKRLVAWVNMRRLRSKHKALPKVETHEITTANADAFVVWDEPNRGDALKLHISGSGDRFSTITGVSWMDDERFIANHRSGLQMAIFDKQDYSAPVWTADLNTLTSDIAIKKVDASTWEASVSGCWDNIYARYQIKETKSGPHRYDAALLETLEHKQRDFCHGMEYDGDGTLCFSIHTGKTPLLSIGRKTYLTPSPWGIRDICWDDAKNRYIAIAVSANPKKAAYGGVYSSLWVLPKDADSWDCLGVYENVHADALDVFENHIWIPDQVNDELVAINALTGAVDKRFGGDGFDFPHGLGISPSGKIAVTNYGTSSIILLDAQDLLARSAMLA